MHHGYYSTSTESVPLGVWRAIAHDSLREQDLELKSKDVLLHKVEGFRRGLL